MRNVTLLHIAPIALGLCLTSTAPAGDRELVVIGGPDTTATERRTLEFETLTDAYLDTRSTRLVDRRRLLRAETARGLVFAEDAITQIRPAVPKPAARALIRVDRPAPQTARTIPAGAAARPAEPDSPGWGQLRISTPDGKGRVYRIGTPSKSDASEARDAVDAVAAITPLSDARFTQVSGIAGHQAAALADRPRGFARPVPRAYSDLRDAHHRFPRQPYHHHQYHHHRPPIVCGYEPYPGVVYIPHYRSYEYRRFPGGGDIFRNPSARYRYFRHRDFD